MTPLVEWVAVALGLIYLLGAVAQWRACWIAGGISSALFLLVFWQADLPMQAALQGYYVAIAIHGWWHWGAKTNGAQGLEVKRWPLAYHGVALVLIALLSAATLLLRDSADLFTAALDASTTWGSVMATWLVARKILETWLYWIVIDAALVVLYLHSNLVATAALFGLYTLIAAAGYFKWRSHWQTLITS